MTDAFEKLIKQYKKGLMTHDEFLEQMMATVIRYLDKE